MDQRVVLYGSSKKVAALIKAAKSLGFSVVASYSSEGIWDLRSSVLDFLHTRPVMVPAHLKELRIALENVAVVSFDDLSKVTMVDVWRAVVPTGKESFRVLLEGMRLVGATFSDWDTKPVRPLTKGDGFMNLAFSKLRQAGADDLAVLSRLSDDDIALISQLGVTMMKNIMQVRPTLEGCN